MSDKKVVINDNLQNLMTGLGTQQSKSANSHFVNSFYTDEYLLTVYRQNWLAAKMVDIPAEDSTREWRSWQAESKQITKIEAVERKWGVQAKVEKGLKWGRLFGGAAIYIGTNASDLTKPLNPEKERIKYLTVLNKRNVTGGDTDYDISSEFFGQPKFYRIISGETYTEVHPTRLVRFMGKPIPDMMIAPSMNSWGWGDSILVGCMAPLLRTESTMANAGELMFKSQVDVIKVPELFAQVGEAQYRSDLLDMISLQTQAVSINKTLLMDKEQDYEAHNATFAGVPELINSFHQEDAGASGIPFTRLLGQSPSGLNSTGESDLRTHYDNIKSFQTLTLSPAMALLDEMIIREALGRRPASIHYNWNNLWYPSAAEQAEIGKKKADTIKTLNDTQLWPSDVLAKAGGNMLVEAGVLPGFEAAMDEYGSLPDNDVDPAPETQTVTDAMSRPLYVSRKVVNVSDITKWAKEQGFTDIEPDLHVTVAYSRDPVDWIAMGQGWSEDNKGNMEVRPGGPRVVEPLGSEGAIVLMFASSDLYWRNRDMREKGASWDYEDYQPHITITYKGGVDLESVAPYTGKIVLGPEIFDEIK